MIVDLSSTISAMQLSILDGSIKPEAIASSRVGGNVTSLDETGVATVLDFSSEASNAVYNSGPIVLLPHGNEYLPYPAATTINGIPVSQIKGAVSLEDGLQYTTSSSSSSISFYTAAGTVSERSQTSASFSLGADTTNNEESLIAKLFSSPTKSDSNIPSEQRSA
ncbi:MAG: hypothetical protein ABF876_09950 [Acetobacter aceti]|uniref:hypothetical protein n=1 Tax=Acetobacteraceae TaxID=433 RepID=UPI0011EA5C9D|nr:hypothetical protein [Acetobacter aceti]